MLSRASVFLVIVICAVLVGGVSLFVHLVYDQDQIAADEAIRQGSLQMFDMLENLPPPAFVSPSSQGTTVRGPLSDVQLADFTAKIRAEQTKPFGDRSPVRWNEYEFLYDATHHILIGRPKFYGRGYWLTIAVTRRAAPPTSPSPAPAPASSVLVLPATPEIFSVTDAGGRWGVQAPDLTLSPDWHAWQMNQP